MICRQPAGRFFAVVLVLAGLMLAASASAQTQATAKPGASMAERSVTEWLMRMHEASRRRAYMGTFVVSAAGQMATSRIAHVCDGEKQIEHVEALTGAPRSTFRRDEEVVTFSPQTRVAVAERRDVLGMFPHLLKSADYSALDQFYAAHPEGQARVAGFEADVLHLRARDKLRFSYRVWSEKKTGLVLKLQTLDGHEHVLEQVAFSELQLDAPINMQKLARMMADTEGYRVEKPILEKTTAAGEGWSLETPVPGFQPVSCYRRRLGGASPAGATAVQWVFSDGLASVSLFLETFDPRRHLREGQMAMGATHTLMRRLGDKQAGAWLTAVGEVPVQTLQAFAAGLDKKR